MGGEKPGRNLVFIIVGQRVPYCTCICSCSNTEWLLLVHQLTFILEQYCSRKVVNAGDKWIDGKEEMFKSQRKMLFIHCVSLVNTILPWWIAILLGKPYKTRGQSNIKLLVVLLLWQFKLSSMLGIYSVVAKLFFCTKVKRCHRIRSSPLTTVDSQRDNNRRIPCVHSFNNVWQFAPDLDQAHATTWSRTSYTRVAFSNV